MKLNYNFKKSMLMRSLPMLAFIAILSLSSIAVAQTNLTDTTKKVEVKHEKKWFETISLRGYTQIRYNRLLETNPHYKNEQGDKSIGDKNGFFLRRVRLIFYGNVHERVYIYIQPDFASSAGTGLHYGQLRDCYFDLSLDKKKEFRIRFGQSKVPYGFENMQSSQNRLSLDRNDALNSAVSNERDLGAFFYWAPAKIRERFSMLVNSGLKGSGDYGVFAFGAYNGQTANKPEANNNLHVVGRLSYPMLLTNGQFIEGGIQAYTGKTTITDNISKGVKTSNTANQYDDYRAAASITVYPQPLGFQAEYNMGSGPEYNPSTNSIQQKKLEGGYALVNYMFKTNHQLIIPFVKYQYYNGGKKFELDARKYRVKEFEVGVEWQPIKNFELVANYTMADRVFEDGTNTFDKKGNRISNQQLGNFLRLQAQFNF